MSKKFASLILMPFLLILCMTYFISVYYVPKPTFIHTSSHLPIKYFINVRSTLATLNHVNC